MMLQPLDDLGRLISHGRGRRVVHVLEDGVGFFRLAALRTDRPGRALRSDQRRPERDRHGPYRMLGYEPNDRVEYVKFARHWKKGFPYMDSMQLKILGDEQARVAALRAGAIDGATLSVEVARSLANNRRT